MRFLRYLLPFFLLASSVFAALPAAMTWEVRVGNANGGASQNNGGGFLSGTSATPVDYSIQDANHFTSTAFKMTAADRSKVWNSSGTAFDTADVNNVLHLTAGTSWTAGWYQVTAVDGNSTATLDRVVAGSYTANSGTGCLGGAFKIGGTLDDNFFEANAAGNTIWIAAGTYSLGESIDIASDGTSAAPIIASGYNSSRGDRPTGNNRPLMSCGAYYWTHTAQYRNYYHLQFTTTASRTALVTPVYSQIVNCKATSFSTVANKAGFWSGTYGTAYIGCEGISRLGYGFSVGSGGSVISCYAHDSDTGIYNPVGSVSGCVVDTCQTGIFMGGAYDIVNNTIRNCVLGISAGTVDLSSILNNIIADCVTGASSVAVENQYWDYNCWSNNGTDVSNVTKGSHDVTADALLVSGTAKGTDGATTVSGLVFTAASNPFGSVTTSDCLNITVAGTGATLGIYAISSVDSPGQITLATSAGASKTGITYCIVLGNDFTLSAGSPAFNAGLKLGSDVGL